MSAETESDVIRDDLRNGMDNGVRNGIHGGLRTGMNDGVRNEMLHDMHDDQRNSMRDHIARAMHDTDGSPPDLLQAVRLRREREACGLSRAQAAESLGWKRARLSELEGGSREPTFDEWLALSRLYTLESIRMIDELERSRNGNGKSPRSARNGRAAVALRATEAVR